MNLKTKTAAQLSKMIKRGYLEGKEAAYEWAERIESGPGKDCKPRKKNESQTADGPMPR